MVRWLVSFDWMGKEASLLVDAHSLTEEEHKQVKGELEKIEGLKFTAIASYNICATILGEYCEVLEVVKQLESSGWEWHGDW